MTYEDIYLPLKPFTQTVGVFSTSTCLHLKTLQENGKYEEKDVFPVNFTLDHRYVDGMLSAKMVKHARTCFENPENIKII